MNDDFGFVREVAADSVLWRAADRLLTSVTESWNHSSARHRSVEMLRRVATLTTADRLRAWTTAIAIGGLVNIVLLARANAYAAPGIPRSVVALTTAFAAVVAVWPHAFLRAWASSTPARIGVVLRRLIYKPAE